MSSPRQIVTEFQDYGYFLKLRRGAWFGKLAESLALSLFSIGYVAEYRANDIVYSDDQPRGALMAVLEGTVHGETFDRTGRRVLVCTGPAGTWFGGIAERPLGDISLTIQAFQPARVWHAPSSALKRLLREKPELVDSLVELEARRVNTLIEMVCVAQRPTATARIAGSLALISRIYRDSDVYTETPVIHLTQADLADMTGHSRQTINAVIAQLQKDQLIKVGHRRIEILDAGRLDAFGDI